MRPPTMQRAYVVWIPMVFSCDPQTSQGAPVDRPMTVFLPSERVSQTAEKLDAIAARRQRMCADRGEGLHATNIGRGDIQVPFQLRPLTSSTHPLLAITHPITRPLKNQNTFTHLTMTIPFYKPAPPPPGVFYNVPLPERRAGWLSKLFFHWVTPILKVGYARPLEADGKHVWL